MGTWAVRDSLSGAVYPQPNKTIALMVAEAHGNCEVFESETKVEVTYLHRYEYRTRREDGTWTEPEVRYHNPTDSEAWARRRHAECKPYEHTWNRKFEGMWGYAGDNDVLVRRTITTTITEEELTDAVG